MPPAGRDERERALDSAVRALARRDHSAASLRAKLARSGISEQAGKEALERLAGAGYLDDARFARGRAEQLGRRGYGDERIGADLEAQGVAPELAAEAIASLAPERERAAEQAARLGGGPKAARTLRRRGFSEDSCEWIAARTVAEEP